LSLAPATLCFRKLGLKVAVEGCLVEVWRVMRNSHSFEAEIDTDNLLSVGGGWTLNHNDKIAIPTAARSLVGGAPLPVLKQYIEQQKGAATSSR
jgi:hypothetical protein